MNLFQNKYTQHFAAIFILLIVAGIYFYPETQGKKILSHDQVSSAAAYKEIGDYKEKGDKILWTSRIFSGMPAFQVAYTVDQNLLIWVYKSNLLLPKSLWLSFMLMFGFYLSLSILGYPMGIRLLGAISFALSTWFLLSIEAGHSTKMVTVSFIPPLIASILISYRGKWLLGGVLTSLFLGLAIMANHIQIIYFSVFFIAILFFVKLFKAFQEKDIAIFFKRTLILIAFGILGILPNITLLWTTYDYGNSSTRNGKSELTKQIDEKQGSGLDLDYAMAWSYGQSETINLLIPGVYGPGASLNKNSETYQELRKKGVPKNQIKNYLKGIPMYYGTQSTPSGPSYMGAGLIFLFLLMFFLYKGNFKWILLGTIILSIVFSWGGDFLIVNEFFFNHFPLFNKFRTPSMWLSLTMICISFGAMLSLKIIYEKQYDSEKLKKALFISGGILGGFSILTYLFGSSMLDFDGPYDAQMTQNGFPMDSVIQDRVNLVKSDALRTFAIIALLFGTIWAVLNNKLKSLTMALSIISLIVIGDMWFVGKRFLNSDDFTKAKSFEKSIVATAADLQILNDKEVNYRVFNTSVNSFNELTPSYFHQHVGGYSAVKLSRYQDLIERHLSKGNMNVFNMLNAKYFITGQPGQEVAQQNPGAYGSVWFVDKIDWAKNADEEMEKLTDFDPRSTVIIDKRFKDYIRELKLSNNPQNSIKLSSFHPDNMAYSSNSTTENFAVFSEIWYKGNEDWKAYIDGKETEFIRVNYLLRGMKIPAGKHEITFKFYPQVHYIGSKISLASSILIILMLLGLVIMIAMGKDLPGMKED
ncbi:MAG: hypothetical protein COB15_13270 [Flavobacteriales bacterium]|nr:MAG: hypothetical protein COB15_13270 [Flavobacteriales bacterium]